MRSGQISSGFLIKLSTELCVYRSPSAERTAGRVAPDSKPGTNRAENVTETDAGTSSLPDPEQEYKMNHNRRGRALIFNHEKYHWRHPNKLGTRAGTEFDRNNLDRILRDLNFEVEIYDDRTSSEVLEKINEASKADHSDADCFVLAFLSHGDDGKLFTHDGEISINDITSPFKGDKCRSLVGKPKIFIIQACRGETYDDPVTAASADDDEDELMVEDSAIHTLPAGADFIMCYSVAEGYVSLRNRYDGSWYIQDLCKMLQNYGKSLEFTDILTLVNNCVSKRSVEPHLTKKVKLHGKKQMPCFASMLTKKLYFRTK